MSTGDFRDYLKILTAYIADGVEWVSGATEIDVAWIWLALVMVALIAVMWVGWRLKRWWQGVLLGFHRRRGAAGEDKAANLLRDAGYEILDDQAKLQVTWLVNDDPQVYDVRADYLVRKSGKRFVAEVKTGDAADLGDRQTRRQLLEYAVVFDCDGVLLVDASNSVIYSVVFPKLQEIRGS